VGKPFCWREFSQTGNSSLAVLVIAGLEQTGQVEQTELPIALLKVPSTQAAHEQPFGPVYPALHKQLFKRVLPAAELEFPGQLLD
jgi:hypothetical protein